MLKRQKKLLNIIFLAGISALFSIDAAITIQYAEPSSNGAVPTISTVLFTQGRTNREIPHVTLAELVGGTTRSAIEGKDALFKSWKQFYIAQIMTYFSAGGLFAANYINDDNVAAFKKTYVMQEMMKKIGGFRSITYKIGISASLVALAIFPFIRYAKFFDLQDISFSYPYEEVEDRIAVFSKKTYSHSRQYGNTVIHYYNISDPIGYMTLDEKEKEFKTIHRASHYINLSFLNAVLCGTGVTWALLRYT